MNRIVSKIILFMISILILSFSVFSLSRLSPIDPLTSYYGERVEKMSEVEKEQARDRLGLNDSLLSQYGIWVKKALKGDFGISYKYKEPVVEIIKQRIVNTVLLSGVGIILTFLLSLLLGVFLAIHEESWIDQIVCKLGIVTSSIPEFYISLLFILFFSVILKWLPSSGAYALYSKNPFLDRIIHLIMPVSVIVISHLYYYSYLVKSKMSYELQQDYVLLAKLKGLSQTQIIYKHCLPNVMITLLNMFVLSFAHILGGTYIIEMVFSYPGIGMLAYESARYSDYNMLMLICILTAILIIGLNMIISLISEHIDIRMKGE